RLCASVPTMFTITKLAALVGIVLLGVLFANSAVLRANKEAFWGMPSETEWMALITQIGVAMVGSLFAADAWNNVTFVAGEVKNPERTLPRALALGTGLVMILYILINLAYLSVLPLTGSPDATTVMGRGIEYAAEDRVGTAAAEVVFGPTGAIVMAIAVMISTFGCNNGLILAGARVSY